MAGLAGKRVVVTAGANGIGAAIVRRFAAEDASIVFCDIDEAAGAATAEAAGAHVTFQPADCGDSPQLRRFVEAAISRLGGVDVLVNNAGIAIVKTLLDLEEDQLDRTLAVNLKAAVIASQLVSRRMIADGVHGAIVNMSSVNGVLTIPNLLAYNISKGALDQLTRNSAVALAEHGIRVNAIGPGTILTDLVRRSIFTSEEARRTVMSRTPLRRAGEPEEVADVALFLASDQASYVTGQVIYVDGGRMALNYTVPTD